MHRARKRRRGRQRRPRSRPSARPRAAAATAAAAAAAAAEAAAAVAQREREALEAEPEAGASPTLANTEPLPGSPEDEFLRRVRAPALMWRLAASRVPPARFVAYDGASKQPRAQREFKVPADAFFKAWAEVHEEPFGATFAGLKDDRAILGAFFEKRLPVTNHRNLGFEATPPAVVLPLRWVPRAAPAAEGGGGGGGEAARAEAKSAQTSAPASPQGPSTAPSRAASPPPGGGGGGGGGGGSGGSSGEVEVVQGCRAPVSDEEGGS